MDPQAEEPVDAVDFDFGSKKKKKKKKDEDAVAVPDAADAPSVAASAAATVPDVAAVEEALEDFSFDKKKKKKKSKLELDSGEMDAPVDAKPADAAEHEDTISLELHKKKRSKKSYSEFVAELGDYETTDESSTKKKKKVTLGEQVPDVDDEEEDEDAGEDDGLFNDGGAIEGDDMGVAYDQDPMLALQGTDRDYSYQELLSRAFYKMRQANPDLGDKKRYTMIPPQILREGTKKTIFGNLMDICKRMHRNQEHVMQFLFTELGTSGSLDGSQRLVIKGRYTPKIIENVLRHYIVEYVTCKICKSPNTVLVKENRLNFVHCEACNSTRSVAAIKSGFSAQIGRRKH